MKDGVIPSGLFGGGMDPRLATEAEKMWKQLEEMSTNDPSAYKKFIAEQMRAGAAGTSCILRIVCMYVLRLDGWVVYVCVCVFVCVRVIRIRRISYHLLQPSPLWSRSGSSCNTH
jgi:hypothetical protein